MVVDDGDGDGDGDLDGVAAVLLVVGGVDDDDRGVAIPGQVDGG